MAVITNYATLQTEVANWLNRSDLTTAIPAFIDSFEKKAALDERLRKLKSATFTADAEDKAVPSDFDVLESLEHDGGTYYGALETVGADQMGSIKARYGDTGAPRFVAIIDDKFRFAPAPDTSYTLRITYWQTFGAGIASDDSWLFDLDPYIYLYGALVEAAPYLKDDERATLWAQMLDARIENVRSHTDARHSGGTLRRQFRAIG